MYFCSVNILSRVVYPFVAFDATPKHIPFVAFDETPKQEEVKEREMVEEGTSTSAVSGMHVLAVSCFSECCFRA
jgi:hypothetical protein